MPAPPAYGFNVVKTPPGNKLARSALSEDEGLRSTTDKISSCNYHPHVPCSYLLPRTAVFTGNAGLAQLWHQKD